MARIPVNAQELKGVGRSASGEVDAHGIQAFYTGLVAEAAGLAVDFTIDGEDCHYQRDSKVSLTVLLLLIIKIAHNAIRCRMSGSECRLQ